MNAHTPDLPTPPVLPICPDVASITYPWQGEDLHDLGSIKEIYPGFFWVRMPVPFDLESINLWLIDEGESWTIVDTGVGDDTTAQAWREIFKTSLDGRPVGRVIGTHMHVDHIGLAGWMCRKYPGAEFWMTQLEYLTARMVSGHTAPPPQEGIDFLTAAGWDEEHLEGYKKHYGLFSLGMRRLPESFHRLYDGMEFEMGGQTWQVIEGSGHSPQHACLYCPALNMMIAGDQLLPRISSNVSVHLTEPDADPLADWIASCKKLKAALPADVFILPAHNEPFFGAHKRLDYLIDGHEKSLTRLHRKLGLKPMSVVDTFVTLFGRKIGKKSFGLATGEAMAHLNCLIHRGLVVRETDEAGVWQYRAI